MLDLSDLHYHSIFTCTALPSTTHQMSTGGLESEVEHSKLRLSPGTASLGPLTRTCFGPSVNIRRLIAIQTFGTPRRYCDGVLYAITTYTGRLL